jgi:hypothetical protein
MLYFNIQILFTCFYLICFIRTKPLNKKSDLYNLEDLKNAIKKGLKDRSYLKVINKQDVTQNRSVT